MNARVLMLPVIVTLLTSCESYRENYFTGEIRTADAIYQLAGARSPLGSSRGNPSFAEWNYYPEGVSRILAIRSPRQQNYSGFQISCPSNSFGVFLLHKTSGPLAGSRQGTEIVLHGSLVFKNAAGTAFQIEARSADEREAVNGSIIVKRQWEFQPMLPFVGLAMMFGAGGATTMPRPTTVSPGTAPYQPESRANGLEENGRGAKLR